MPTLAEIAGQQKPGAPAFADVWQYTPFQDRWNYGTNNNANNPFYDQSQNVFQFSGGAAAPAVREGSTIEGQGGHWSGAQGENGVSSWIPDAVQMTVNEAAIPEKYRGLVAGLNPAEEHGQGTEYKYDLSKLPNGGMTKFGTDVMGTTSLGTDREKGPDWGRLNADTKAANKNAVYYDENYGWITPNANIADDGGFMNTAGPAQIVMALMSMGYGNLGMPAMAAAGVGGARTMGNGGNWKDAALNIAPGVIGAGLGGAGMGLPPDLSRALQLAKVGYGGYNAMKRGNPVGMAGTGLSLAQMGGFGQ